MTIRLRTPANYGLPGEFDRVQQLATQGVLATGYLTNDRGLMRLTTAPRRGVALWLAATRQRATKVLAAVLPPRRAALLKALLLGDRSDLSQTDRRLLSRAGIAHLFSISGLHLGLLSALLYLLLETFYKRSRQLLEWQPPSRVLPLLIGPLLWCYVQLAGSGYPVQRAFYMLAGGTLLYYGQRRTRPLQLLLGGVFLLLLLQPMALFSPALQLSVAGLAGILLLVPRWQGYLEPLPIWLRWPASALLITLAGTLATLPLIWQSFHILSTAGPLLNLLGVPVIGMIALPAGLLGLLCLPLSQQLAVGLFQVAGWLAEQLLNLSHQVLHWPGLGGLVSFPDHLQLAGAWLLVLAVMTFDPARQRSWRRVLPALAGGLVLLVLPYPQPAGARVTALSVGQGESLLLSFAGHNYLLDGGGHYQRSFDVGERLVAPALGRLGVHRLDGVILSHDHPDHRLGLLYVLQHLPVTAFYSAIPAADLDPELNRVLQQHPEIHRIRLPEDWSRVAAEGNWQLQAWAPPQDATDINDRSVVVLLHNDSQGALFTGDLARTGLARLAGEPVPGPVTLLKLPHHGSRNSDPTELLQRWHPSLAVVSVGRDNHFGFPNAEVCACCIRFGARLYRTDRDGTVIFTAGPSGWQTETYANRLFR